MCILYCMIKGRKSISLLTCKSISFQIVIKILVHTLVCICQTGSNSVVVFNLFIIGCVFADMLTKYIYYNTSRRPFNGTHNRISKHYLNTTEYIVGFEHYQNKCKKCAIFASWRLQSISINS